MRQRTRHREPDLTRRGGDGYAKRVLLIYERTARPRGNLKADVADIPFVCTSE
jgi:hypothetical protein